jgi:peptide methionine sulfoxide reductase MsrA
MQARTWILAVASVAFACSQSEAQKDPAKTPPTAKGPREVAMLGAGCFWGVETWMMKMSGIVDVDVGYAGGKSSKVSYEDVVTGTTGHAEAVRIVYDPSVVSYEQLLVWFFKIHDPTTKDRQGNDVGPQYRSAIFPTSDATWVRAEDYHQDYLVKHPNGYDNHFARDLKF